MPDEHSSSNPPPYIESPPSSPGAGSSLSPDSDQPQEKEDVRAHEAKKRRFPLKVVLLVLLGLTVIGLVLLWLLVPDVSILKDVNPRQTSFMRYRMQQNPKRRIPDLAWTHLERISPHLIRAVLIAEDDKFFQHEGFDWDSMRQAMESNIKKKKVLRGGSTITQQLGKNLFLTPSRSLIRKIREMAIAFALEKALSKKRILELYLNVVEWGDGIFGITAAARIHFGVDPASLSASQAIRLASVLPNPVRFHVSSDESMRMNKKRRTIAERMLKRNFITQEEFAQVLKELGLDQGNGQ